MKKNILQKVGGIVKKSKHKEKLTGLDFHKSRGQHILKKASVINDIVEKAGIKSTDIVLEIGPGTGNLTIQLLEKAKKVIVIEVDNRLVLELSRRIDSTPYKSKLEIIKGDVLKTKLPYFDICVANIPYNISSPIVFKLLAHRPIFRAATIMFQREFAMRLVAQPGESNYCRLSINTQMLSRVYHLMKVSRMCFLPPPKVDSSVIRIEPKHPLPDINFIEWDSLIRICFQRKNRTLSALFSNKKLLKNLEKSYLILKKLNDQEKNKFLNEDVDLEETFRRLSLNDDVDIDNTDIKKKKKNNKNDMDIDCDSDGESINGENEFKQLVKRVLGNEFSEKRASKMDINDFLTLLACFNSANIHFS